MLASAIATAAQQVDQTDYAPGLIAFLVIFALAIASWLLFRSMTKHIRRANRNEPSSGDAAAAGGEPTAQHPDAGPDAPRVDATMPPDSDGGAAARP